MVAFCYDGEGVHPGTRGMIYDAPCSGASGFLLWCFGRWTHCAALIRGLVSIGELASRDEHTEPVMLSLGRSVLIELNFATWVVQNSEV